MIIGLTGYAGSGKSTAAAMLAERGATVIDADRLGHAALADPGVAAKLRAHFGDGVFAAGGDAVDRARLAAAVFSAPAELAFLEGLSHPWIAARVAERCRAATAPLTVVDAALLKVLRLGAMLARVLLVSAPFAARLARVRARGWDEAELRRRDAALAGRAYAPGEPGVVEIVNDAGPEDLRRRLDALDLFPPLVKRQGKKHE